MQAPTVHSCTDPGPWRYNDRWPWLHLALAFWMTTVLILRWQVISGHPRWLIFFWFGLITLLFHQFEEYGVPGGFRRWFNRYGFGSANPAFPLTKSLAQRINTVALLVAGPVAAWAGTYEIWAGLAFLYANAVNALFHITASQLDRRYSPGSVTGGLLLLPLACYATWRFVASGEALPFDLALAGAIALVVQGLLFLWPRRAASRYPELLRVNWSHQIRS